MTIRNRRLVLFMSFALVVTTLPGVSAAAAQSLPADSTRLDQLRRDLQTELRRVDAQPAAQSARLRDELEDLRDEVGYLRVVQRRGQKIQELGHCHGRRPV